MSFAHLVLGDTGVEDQQGVFVPTRRVFSVADYGCIAQDTTITAAA